MSYRGRNYRGSFRRGNHSGYSQHNDDRSSNFNDSGKSEAGGRGRGRGRGRGSHPPGLKGRELGMYYRNKSIQKQKKQEEMMNKRKVLEINPKVEQEIKSLLESEQLPLTHGTHNKDLNQKDKSVESGYEHIGDSQFKRKFLQIISGNIQDNLSRAMLKESSLERDKELDKLLYDEFMNTISSNTYKKMMEFRAKLPAYQMRKEIIDRLKEEQVILISGETGCGKTTQVAQFILDHEIQNRNGSITNIACTQPRRISAITVAERVAAERAESLGTSVGFQIRLEKTLPRQRGNILFCTTAMLLQFMQGDPALRCFSHIIIDEIHERSTESDFIIALLKQVIPKRSDLKVILMSATLNAEQFSKYYNNCPTIFIPGQTYPVTEYYLEDVLEIIRFKFEEDHNAQNGYKRFLKKYKQDAEKKEEFSDFVSPYVRHLQSMNKYSDYVTNELLKSKSEVISLELIEQLLKYICLNKGPGAILIFLPGLAHISKLHKLLLSNSYFNQAQFEIYPLHSRMPTVQQKQIFRTPPDGIRKIIIATNIAETSITIEDVVYVIDCGKTKYTKFDLSDNIETLEPDWITLANAKQRKGRAGRVQPGVCYHLYTKLRESVFEQFPIPEILRSRLEEVILKLKILQLGKAKEFLSTIMDPPDSKAINLSIDLLQKLNALDNSERLTPLGYHLAQLPLDPRTGKMIILASLFSCIDPVFSIAASLSFKDAFYCPIGKESEANAMKKKLCMSEQSDHIAMANALLSYENKRSWKEANDFCYNYFLSKQTLDLLKDMKTQFATYLCDMKFLESSNPKHPSSNENSSNIAVIKAIICAGLFPNIAIIKRMKKFGALIVTPEDGRIKIHPSSVNVNNDNFPYPYLTYFLKRRTTDIFLFDTTCISPNALLMASPESSQCDLEDDHYVITISEGIQIYCQPRLVNIVQKLQKKLNELFEYKINHPGVIRWDHAEGKILKSFIALVSQERSEFNYQSEFQDE